MRGQVDAIPPVLRPFGLDGFCFVENGNGYTITASPGNMPLMEDVPTKRRNVRWFRAATRWHEENTLHIPNAVVRRRMSDALKNSARVATNRA